METSERVLDAPQPREAPAGGQRLLLITFTFATFLGASLLFLVQPLVGRLLLPMVGGSASLWNTAMVFFQVTLLAGYLYSHLSISALGTRRQSILQIGLLIVPLAVLPIAVPAGWALTDGVAPELWTLSILAVMVGLPFFVVSTASPTLQRWFADTGHPHAADPYFLYAAGNVGSLLALLAYPFVIEPNLSLEAQGRLWAALYVVFGIAAITCVWLMRRYPGSAAVGAAAVPTSPPIAPRRRAKWVFWAFVPSALMLGVTRHVATDLASFPLLWIVPLVLYLLTFIIAFGRSPAPAVRLASKLVLLGSLPLALTFVGDATSTGAVVAIHLGWFFFAALLGHARLSEDRPAAGRLTEFYAWISVGGALGGLFAALLAPAIFDQVLEYPIVIVAAMTMIPGAWSVGRSRVATAASVIGLLAVGVFAADLVRDGSLTGAATVLGLVGLLAYFIWQRAGLTAVVALACLVGVAVPLPGLIHQERSFFGVYKVVEEDGWNKLVSGTTTHGRQRLEGADRASAPTSYYHEAGPLGQALDGVPSRNRLGLVGLGAGEIAAYGRSGDAYTYFEIDPTVVDIASNPEYFTYLAETQATVGMEVGDGRLLLERSTDVFDMIVIDAFSSDAIPVHLMTVEAVEIYLDRLTADGLLLLHISNRHFDLAPVLGRITEELGLVGDEQLYRPTREEYQDLSLASHWVAIARDEVSLAAATSDSRWQSLPTDGPLWTDDYSDILSVLEW